jgi:hypothetical protein
VIVRRHNLSEGSFRDEEYVQVQKKDMDNMLRDNELLIERCSRLIERNSELEGQVSELEHSLTMSSLGRRTQSYGTGSIIGTILCLLGGFLVFTQGMAFVINYSALVDPILGYLAWSPLYSYLSSDNYLVGITAIGMGGLLLICSIFMPVTSPRMVGGFVLFSSLVALLVGGGYGLGSLLGVVGSGIAIAVGE